VVLCVRIARRKTKHHSVTNDDAQVCRFEHTPTMASATVARVWTTPRSHSAIPERQSRPLHLAV
jgi:hypothetical protein